MLRLVPSSQQRLCLPLPYAAFACRFFVFHSLVVSLHPTRDTTRAAAQYSSISEDSHGALVEKKSKGQKKREALRAVEWAVQLSSLTNSQLLQAIRWGGLQEAVFDAITLVKKIGRDGKNARRRQLNLIGGMLRSVNPDLMEEVIKATKNGDVNGLFTRPSEDVDHAGFLEEEEAEKKGNDTAEQWLQGLLSGDSKVCAEVYSVSFIDFDRQELKKLVKDALQTESVDIEKENQADSESASAVITPLPTESLSQKRRKLHQFLEDLAVKVSGN